MAWAVDGARQRRLGTPSGSAAGPSAEPPRGVASCVSRLADVVRQTTSSRRTAREGTPMTRVRKQPIHRRSEHSRQTILTPPPTWSTRSATSSSQRRPSTPAGRFEQHLAALRSVERQTFTADGNQGVALRYGLVYDDDPATRTLVALLRQGRLALPLTAAGPCRGSTWTTPWWPPWPRWSGVGPGRPTTWLMTSRCAGATSWARWPGRVSERCPPSALPTQRAGPAATGPPAPTCRPHPPPFV
jgi:hypothetical protein